jgi:DNA adenine methylase
LQLERKKDPSTLTDIQRACRYFYLQKSAFGGKTSGRTFGTGAKTPARLNLSTIDEILLEVHWRLSRVTVEHLDACECIERYDRPATFFYLDPPYWKTAGYAVPFGPADYERVVATLLQLQGRFLLSLNDTPDVRRLFRPFRIRKVTTTYSTGNGRHAKGSRSIPKSEVLIDNYLWVICAFTRCREDSPT